MTRFLCVCLAPALDATAALPARPEEGGVTRVLSETVTPGGKALNVARYLASRGAETACAGLLGADNAAPFEEEMARYGIADRFIRVPGETRRNEMFTMPGGCFKINRPAFPGLPFRGFPPGRFLGGAGPGVTVVIAGGLPPSAPPGFYAALVRAAKAAGAAAVLDAEGEALRLGLAAGPGLIKPNREECAAAAGFAPDSPEGFRRASAILLGQARHVILSDGAAGAWFDGAFFPSPRVEAVDTTAAGDILLAEYCLSRDPRRAVAAGAAACTLPGGAPPPTALVDRLARQSP